MKRFVTLFFISLCITGTSPSQVPDKFSYQGLLTTSAGAPVADSLYNLRIDIYNAPSGGALRFSETFSGVSVRKGTFAVLVGSTNPLPPIFAESLYVEMVALAGPGGYSYPLTFSPRTDLVSSPYSLSLRTPASLIDSTGSNVLTVINNSNGRGIFSQSRNYTGVKAMSTNAFGIAGIGSTNNAGVYGSTVDALLYFANSGTNGYSHLGSGAVGLSDSGVGLVGWANTNQAWGGYIYGKFGVSGSYTPSGDTLVQLPDNSIAAHEILDEPGIASVDEGVFTAHALPLATVTAIDSVVITTPAAGYIDVSAGGLVLLSHGIGTESQMWFWVEDAVAGTNYDGFQDCNVPAGAVTGGYYLNYHCHWMYAKGAGTYKFYLKSNNEYGSTSNETYGVWVSAIYFPTAYGAVNSITPSAEAADYPGARIVQAGASERAPGSPGLGPMYQVDLRELELRAAKARAESEHADRLLIEARLKNELKKGESGDH